MTPPTVGIDLGTTYSVVAVYRNARIQILPNTQSIRKSTTASYVSYGEKELLVGDPAKKKLVSNQGNVVYDMKRLLGKSYADPTVEKSKKYWNFKLEPDGIEKPVVVIKYLGNTLKIRPEDVSAKVLERMAAVAADGLGEKPTKAVITVPAYFNQAQKQATLDAAKKAGLEVPELITEPAAAAYAFTFDKNRLNGNYNLLVYDFGGGTFDVVVVNVDNGNVKIKAIGGDTHLGGRDIDDRLSDHVSKMIYQRCGEDCTGTRRNRAKLMQKVEEMKIELSDTLETSVYIGDLFTEIDEEITIKRGELENLCEDIFVKTIELTKRTLKDAKMSPSDIEEVLLVGGSTRIPRVLQLLGDLFPGKTLNQTIDADEAVAYGAAIRAAQIDGVIKADISLTEATPLSLGTDTVGDCFSEIIPRNSSIPITQKLPYYTSANNQTRIAFNIYEGVRPIVDESNRLGTIEINDLDKGEAGSQCVELTLSLDKNGILSVYAEYKGCMEHMMINYADVRKSCARSIEQMINDAERYAGSDEQERKRREKRFDLGAILEKIGYRIDGRDLTNSEMMEMQKKYDEVRKWHEQNAKAPLIDIEMQIESLRKMCERFSLI
uniref:Heat shock protein 70 n=1 Tax=Plectus sambesii TaxID=2011161 RepID=A0A914W965_9BILA